MTALFGTFKAQQMYVFFSLNAGMEYDIPSGSVWIKMLQVRHISKLIPLPIFLADEKTVMWILLQTK